MRKLLATLLMVPCIAHAEFWTGNNLYNKMNSVETMDRIHALGYVMGVFDTAAGVDHCGQTMGNITSGQARDVAKQYLDQNPALRDMAADVLVRVAFSRAWPCPKSNNKGGKGA